MSNRNIGPSTKCPLRGQSRPGQILLMIFHLEAKTCPSLNAQRRQIAEVEWLNFLNKILVENQSVSAASSFKPSACLATRQHWVSLCLSRTRGTQEGEPRASARQSELARQNSHLARQTQSSPRVPQPPFLPCRPSPSPCPQPVSVALILSFAWAAMGELWFLPSAHFAPSAKSVFFLYYCYLSRSHLSFITWLLNEAFASMLLHSLNRYSMRVS